MKNAYGILIIAIFFSASLIGCSNTKEKENRISYLQRRISSMQSSINHLSNNNKARTNKLLSEFGNNTLETIQRDLLAKNQRFQNQITHFEQSLRKARDRKKNLVNVNQIYDDFATAEERFKEFKKVVVIEQSLFVQKEKEFPFCGDEIDCLEDFETLKVMNKTLIAACEKSLDNIRELVDDYRQQLVNVNFMDVQDEKKARLKLKKKQMMKSGI